MRFFADYQEGIRSLDQLRLEYEQKRLIRAIVSKKEQDIKDKEKRLEDLFPQPEPPKDYPSSEWPNKEKGKNWYEPLTPASVPVAESGGVVVSEITSLEQIFKTYAEIYKKDYSKEL